MMRRAAGWLAVCVVFVLVASAGIAAPKTASHSVKANAGKEAVRLAEVQKVKCGDSAAGPLVAQAKEGQAVASEGALPVLARVGKPAPDFEAMGYYKGDFVKVKLSDYRGKWVVLCFYPADFTFV